MDVTVFTWIVGIAGLVIMAVLVAAQLVAVIRPRAGWTVENVYGGDPGRTDPKAYFAFNCGLAVADVFFWAPVQIAGSIGMLVGQRWGFVLAVAGSIPFIYTAILLFIWDRDLGFRKHTPSYWVTWGIFPAFGALQMVYCLARIIR
jgi:hypothetical protein